MMRRAVVMLLLILSMLWVRSARTMLQNGDYRLWTSGPVAQTIILGDDTTTRKYDIGFGDGYHPFRPHFYATPAAAGLATAPKWAIVPRTDPNALPAIPTATPPG